MGWIAWQQIKEQAMREGAMTMEWRTVQDQFGRFGFFLNWFSYSPRTTKFGVGGYRNRV